MRLYNLYKLNILQKLESENITNTNIKTQVNKTPVSIKGLSYFVSPYKKTVITEQDRKSLLPYLEPRYTSLDGSKVESRETIMFTISTHTKCNNLISRIPQCLSLKEIETLMSENKLSEPNNLSADQLVQILDTLLMQMHKLNIERFGIPLNVISLKSDIDRVWYDDVDDNYNLLAEVMQKFSGCRKTSIDKCKYSLKEQSIYKNFLAYAKIELGCLYNLILCLGS